MKERERRKEWYSRGDTKCLRVKQQNKKVSLSLLSMLNDIASLNCLREMKRAAAERSVFVLKKEERNKCDSRPCALLVYNHYKRRLAHSFCVAHSKSSSSVGWKQQKKCHSWVRLSYTSFNANFHHLPSMSSHKQHTQKRQLLTKWIFFIIAVCQLRLMLNFNTRCIIWERERIDECKASNYSQWYEI